MAGSSPTRRNAQVASPERPPYGTYLSAERNNLTSHHEALAASKDEHDRVRDYAIRALEKHAHRLERLRLEDEEAQVVEKQKRERERLERERKLREEEKRLRELEAQQIPKLPPKPPPATVATSPKVEATGTNGIAKDTRPTGPSSSLFGLPSSGPFAATPTTVQANGGSSAGVKPAAGPTPQQATPDIGKETGNAPKSNPFAATTKAATTSNAAPAPSPFATAPKPAAPATNPFGKPAGSPAVNGSSTAAPTPIPSAAASSAAQTQAAQRTDRYVQIHQSLKRLRASLKQQMTTNQDLKKNAGNMRREIRKSIGQLTGERGANKQQLEKIRTVLTMALHGQPQSAMLDPSEYVRDQREPVQDAVHNGELPSLFVYLLNCLAKDMIKQFDGECGPMPDKADPIGVTAAQVFSTRDFLWRGQSLIDIMMAKFRVACPVLFGIRGNEKMEQGRSRLGWRRPDGQWMPEQQHMERMSGLGVGYASIALRDFSRAKNTNPYPPANYWTSLAMIVNTPPAEISDTQCVVLRAMIYLYEDKFINFYGNQAIAALRKALIEFPAKAPNKTSAVTGLTVLASLYHKDLGLDLR
ncbi:GLE1-like protein [Seiridium cupressi]